MFTKIEKKEKITLTDVWRKDGHIIKKGIINLIVSPVGSGKTYFVFNELIKDYNLNEVIYLCDTSNLERGIRIHKKYSHLLKYRSEKKEFQEFGLAKGFDNNKIEVMTFAKFGHDLLKDPNCFNHVKLIIVDECHKLLKFRDHFDNKSIKVTSIDENGNEKVELKENDKKIYTETLNKLRELQTNTDIVMLTATKGRFHYKKEKENETGFYIDDMRVMNFFGKVTSMETLIKSTFKNIKNIPALLDKEYKGFFRKGYKVLLYTDNIKTAKNLCDMFAEVNLRAIPLWSINNTTHKMTPIQLKVRETILNTNELPTDMDIDILIITGSYETGIDIYDENEVIQMMIINNSSDEVIDQSRGRIRHDIIQQLSKEKNSSNKIENQKVELKEEWLNRNLTKKDKDVLVNELNICRTNGEQLKWTSIKKILEFNKYIVTNKMARVEGKPTKVSVITR